MEAYDLVTVILIMLVIGLAFVKWGWPIIWDFATSLASSDEEEKK